jgi:hypothetical protein
MQQKKHMFSNWLNKLNTYPTVQKLLSCYLGKIISPTETMQKHMAFHENFGHRISHIDVDYIAATVFKAIFGDVIDGYISPTLPSLWHGFAFHPEVCLFNPQKTIGECNAIPLTFNAEDAIPSLSIMNIIESSFAKEIPSIKKRNTGQHPLFALKGGTDDVFCTSETVNIIKTLRQLPTNLTSEPKQLNIERSQKGQDDDEDDGTSTIGMRLY